MFPSESMSERVGGKLYKVQGSTLLAHSRAEDEFLYRTARGAYFLVYLPDGEPAYIDPIDEESAADYWSDTLNFRDEVSFELAFPGVETEEA